MDDISLPLYSSTPKKAKLDQKESAIDVEDDYIFISSSSEEDSAAYPQVQDDSSLLFVSCLEESGNSCFIIDSTDRGAEGSHVESESVLFLSSTLESDQENFVQANSMSLQDCLCHSDTASLQLQEEPSAVFSDSKAGSFAQPDVECCAEQCLQKFATKDRNEITKFFQSKSQEEQRLYLHDIAVYSLPLSAKLRNEKFMVHGHLVCIKAFAILLGTTPRRLERVKLVRMVVHGNKGMKRPTSKSLDAAAWMKSYFDRMGDHMPDCNRIHLPSFLNKREVYQKMHEDLSESGLKDIISQSTFYDLWEKDFSYVLIPEVSFFIMIANKKI